MFDKSALEHRNNTLMRKVRNILTRVFKDHPRDFDVRLWDGRSISWGQPPRFTLVFNDKATFKRIARSGSALALGAAFIEKRFDIEGDIFAAVKLVDHLGGLKLSLRERLSLLVKLMTL